MKLQTNEKININTKEKPANLGRIRYTISSHSKEFPMSDLERMINHFRDIFLKEKINPSLKLEDLDSGDVIEVDTNSIFNALYNHIVQVFDGSFLGEIHLLVKQVIHAYPLLSQLESLLSQIRDKESPVMRVFDSMTSYAGLVRDQHVVDCLIMLILVHWDTLAVKMKLKYHIDINSKHQYFLEERDALFEQALSHTVLPFLRES